MRKKKVILFTIGLVFLVGLSAATISHFSIKEKTITRVACVGDSLTQSSEYPYNLWLMLGNESYSLRNFGVGSTTVSLNSETPYMNTSVFQDVLKFMPNIVIVMLGTNDAQPSLHQYNASFIDDYTKLVYAFIELPNKPEVWIVLPPPIFSNELNKIDPQYFRQTVIPSIQQVACLTDLQTVDVYSVLDSPDFFRDGVHVNSKGSQKIADTIYAAIFRQLDTKNK